MLAHTPWLRHGRLGVHALELLPSTPWTTVSATVLRYLRSFCDTLPSNDGKPCVGFRFGLGESHPLYDALGGKLIGNRHSYAWYIRVPDIPGFIRHIAPALEARLAASCCAGYSGELMLSFYRNGVRITFDDGRLTVAEPWQPTVEARGDTSFPFLTFLQLLFGYRSLDELCHAFADCWTHSEETTALLDALWPRRPSCVWGID